MDVWVLTRAAKLLFRMDPTELWKFFHTQTQSDTSATDAARTPDTYLEGVS